MLLPHLGVPNGVVDNARVEGTYLLLHTYVYPIRYVYRHNGKSIIHTYDMSHHSCLACVREKACLMASKIIRFLKTI